MPVARTSLKLRFAVAFLLTAALLLSQWSGFVHRIDHGPLIATQTEAADGTHDHTTDSDHSCIAFDAATVADAVHLPPFAQPLITSVRALALWVAFDSWDAPLVRHFSSRAPPLS